MVNYKKGQVWNKPKIKIMLKFEKETEKSAVYRSKITGQFEYWLWQQEKILQKQLNNHWKSTEKERVLTHSGRIYQKKMKELEKKQISKPKKRTNKAETFKKRKIILEQLYYTLFLTTKDLADILKVPVSEAYKHAKWLENHNLVAGQASSGTGTSTPRGTYRILSILWEPYYHIESYPEIEFKEVVKILKKEMKYNS